MKRKRNLLVVLLLLCTIGLGVGYAALSGTLTIGGNTTVEQQPFDVKFTNFARGTVVNKTTPNSANSNNDLAITCDPVSFTTPVDEVELTVANLRDLDDSISATLTITNFNDVPVNLEDVTIEYGNAQNQANPDEYFKVEFAYNGNTRLEAYNPADGQDGDTTTVTVTITLKKVYVGAGDENDKYTNAFTISIPATPVQS